MSSMPLSRLEGVEEPIRTRGKTIPELLEGYHHQSREADKRGARLNYLSPSRILCGCLRDAVMRSFGYEPPVDPSLGVIFETGTSRHERVQEMLAGAGVLFDIEASLVNHNPNIYGKTDGIFLDDEGNRVIFEMKTTAKDVSKMSEPLKKHVSQAQLYMHMAKAPRAIILYEGKAAGGYSPWRQFDLYYDPAEAQRQIGRAGHILRMIERRRLPASDCYSCSNPACHDKEIHAKEGLVENGI